MLPSSGVFECNEMGAPRGIDIHPITGWLFCRMDNTKITFDGSDCDLDHDEIPIDKDLGAGAIVAMHPKAPQMGLDPYWNEGSLGPPGDPAAPDPWIPVSGDWVIYHDKADYDEAFKYRVVYPMAVASSQYFCWDETG